MAQLITIIGGLRDNPHRTTFLEELNARTRETVDWDWVMTQESSHHIPPTKPFNRLLGRLRKEEKDQGQQRTLVVKLFQLHQRAQGALYRVCDPVLVPKNVDTSQKLAEWLLSPQANLVPHENWYAGAKEAALVAILCKLIKNKSWNKDSQGHQWTKEEDLLGQTPVRREQFQEISREATGLLPGLGGGLLLKKGSGGGQTDKEWCISQVYVPAVKRAILTRSLSPIAAVPEFESLIRRIQRDTEKPYCLNEGIVSERIRQVCRDTRDLSKQ